MTLDLLLSTGSLVATAIAVIVSTRTKHALRVKLGNAELRARHAEHHNALLASDNVLLADEVVRLGGKPLQAILKGGPAVWPPSPGGAYRLADATRAEDR